MPPAPLRFRLPPGGQLVVQRGDLTRFTGDAIVNAANERMLGGGGVDGAMHRAAGPALLEACRAVPEVRRGVRCPTGEARITSAGDLPADHVIHTVGPVYEDPATSAPLLAAAYRSSLRKANEQRLRTIAFPAISCGVYGYPLDEAAEIAIKTCREEVGELHEVHFFLFGARELAAWGAAAEAALEAMPEEGSGDTEGGGAEPERGPSPKPELCSLCIYARRSALWWGP